MLRGTTLWRATRPLVATATRAPRRSSGALSRFVSWPIESRRLLCATATRLASPPTPSTATSSGDPVPTASTPGGTASTTAPPTNTAVDDDAATPPVDLKDVGAETTKVLTIADVLSRREQEFSDQGPAAVCFDEWESIPASHTIQDAIDMMVESSMGSLIVTEENAGIVGIVTERDVLKKTSPRAIAAEHSKPVKDIMTSQIMCIPTTTTVIDALATMSKENIRHLAVINGEIGNAVKKGSVPEEAMRCVLSIKDIVKAYSKFEAQKKQLQDIRQAAAEVLAESFASGPTAAVDGAAAPQVSDAAAPVEEAAGASTANSAPSPATPIVTAATLLKKKHKKVKLILNTRVEDSISVADAVEAMARHNFGSVLVVDKEQRVLGIFTERDYLTRVLYARQDPAQVKMVDVSTKDLQFLQIEDTLENCWNQAAAKNFRHFPVIGTMRKDREKELAGVLSIKDLVREISKGHETPGFRLMEFFKSKMTKDEPASPPPASDAQPLQAPVEPTTSKTTEAVESDPSSTTTTTSTDQSAAKKE